MREIDPHDAIDFILKHSAEYAQAKANRVHLEEFRKTQKALLMNESVESTVNAREQYAYSHPKYQELLAGLKAAVEVEETLRWKIEAARMRVEVFRTQEASNRAIDRATR